MRIRSLPWRTLQVLQLAMTFFSIVCVVIARGHYFIDIIIAYFVTTRIFWIYHTLCTCNASNVSRILVLFTIVFNLLSSSVSPVQGIVEPLSSALVVPGVCLLWECQIHHKTFERQGRGHSASAASVRVAPSLAEEVGEAQISKSVHRLTRWWWWLWTSSMAKRRTLGGTLARKQHRTVARRLCSLRNDNFFSIEIRSILIRGKL